MVLPGYDTWKTGPSRIVLHLNGTRRELLASDRVTDIARIARATSKATGQAARLYCSGWDWPKSETAS